LAVASCDLAFASPVHLAREGHVIREYPGFLLLLLLGLLGVFNKILGVIAGGLLLSFGGSMVNIRRHYATAACAFCFLFLYWPYNLLVPILLLMVLPQIQARNN
jgi:hypothetical protein